MSEKTYSLGIDIGSTTVKTVLRENDTVIYEKYERHLAQVRKKTLEMLEEMRPLAKEDDPRLLSVIKSLVPTYHIDGCHDVKISQNEGEKLQ